jgi:DNA-binding NtrC family response regulator
MNKKLLTLLLVDDEEQFLNMLANRLEQRGYVILTAHSGDEALFQIEKEDINLIILDISMPGRDGMETLKAIKQKRPDIQIIMLTGHGSIQKGIESMKLGASDFLEKPVDFNVLLESISNTLQ